MKRNLSDNLKIVSFEIILISLIVSYTFGIYNASYTLNTKLELKNDMVLVSDELRQSSNDLTHFARSYVVTKDETYKNNYFKILDIRNGTAPRPKNYETIYWDLSKDKRDERHPKEKKISLKERIEKLPFTQEEKDYLILSEENSNDLVNLEVKAFELMAHVGKRKMNQQKAVSMLHSNNYYKAKEKIMEPIDLFLLKVTQRTNEEIVGINKKIANYVVLMLATTIIFILINIYLYFYLKSRDAKYQKEKTKREKRFRDLIESSDNWIWEVDVNGVYTYSSYQVEDMLGYTVNEIIGKRPFDLMEEKCKEKISEKFTQKLNNQEQIVDLVNLNIHKNGSLVYLLTNGIPFYDENGKFMGYRGMDKDISDRKILELQLQKHTQNLEMEVEERTKELAYQANHDVLTALPNRALFNDRLVHSIEKAKRNKNMMALFFIDLDNFKEINDSLGHDAGDYVLIEVAKRIADSKREEDTLARLGGDEFTVILNELKMGEDASLFAQKILDSFVKPIVFEENILYVSTSIGISLYPNDGESIQNLLKYADAAMYKAKNTGRNRFQFYSSEMTEYALQKVKMESSLRESLTNEDFVVFYQPQVDGRDDRLVGMEALVRWNHPQIGFVFPDTFIPLAESTGLIIQIDNFVMKTAMTQHAKWYKEGLNPGILALNLSVKQLQNENFIDYFKALMEATECKAEWLELEVTEGQLMKNPELAIEILNRISELGIELAIDDFGTGYSSLAYLKRLPINKLKIDQSFVRDLPKDEEDAAITKAVISLSKSLGLRIIAEGVETKGQKDFIVEHGCYNIQGYYYSKPVPAEQMEKFVKQEYLK